MSNIITISLLTFNEARRRRMVLVALGMGALFLVLYSLGFWLINDEIDGGLGASSEIERNLGYNLLLMAGFYVVHFLVVMLAIFSSVDTVSGEIASHTIQALVTKPVRRYEILLGKWLGYALMIIPYIALLGGGILLNVYLQAGYLASNPVEALALLMLEALVLFSLSLLGGTYVSTLTNGVILFMLYGVAFIGSWVEQIGALLRSSAAVQVGVVTSLLVPVEALWRRVAYVMQPPFFREMPTPFSSPSAPSGAMVAYAALYAAAALALALRAFSRKDL